MNDYNSFFSEYMRYYLVERDRWMNVGGDLNENGDLVGGDALQ